MDVVTRADILAWRDKQVGSPVSINSRLRAMRTFFGDVCRDMAIPNPTERVKRVIDESTDDDDRADSKVLTADELVRVLAAVRRLSPQHYPLVLTLALTGARFGEASALRWSDIDEDAGAIRIRRAQWRGHVGTTKTRKTRTVALAPELADELRAHRLELWRRSRGPIGVQRSITGHVTQAMSEHYAHVGIGEKREALDNVLRFIRPAPTPPPAATAVGSGGDHLATTPATETALARETLAG